MLLKEQAFHHMLLLKTLKYALIYKIMEDSIVIPSSVKVFVKLGRKHGNMAHELSGMLKEYRKRYTSVKLQEEAMKWWRQSI